MIGKNLFWGLIFTSLLSPSAIAEGYVSESLFQGTEVLAGSELPFQIGAKLKLQLPYHIHLTAGLGYSPEFYSETYGTLAGSMGIMGENTAEVAALSLAGALVADVRAAYSWDPDGGFFVELGYAFITGGGGSVGGDVAEAAYDFDYSNFDAGDSLTVEGSLHAVTVHIGYMYLVSERLSLIFNAGIIKPVMADLDITADGTTASTAAQIETDLKSYLEDSIVSDMLIPTGSLWLSYLF